MPRSKGYSQGKKLAKTRAKNAAIRLPVIEALPVELDGEAASNAEDDLAEDTPPPQPTPPPAATPAAKPSRVLSADLSPGSLEKRRSKKRASDRRATQEKQAAAAAPAVELPAEPYGATRPAGVSGPWPLGDGGRGRWARPLMF